MIAQSTLEITTDNNQILLSPYSASHLRFVLPVGEDVLRYEPHNIVPYYTASDPKFLMNAEVDNANALTWGIFDPHRAGKATVPEAFLGKIVLSRDLVDNERPTDVVKVVGTMLFNRQHMNRGIGTLAKLGIAKYAFGGGRTHALRADTAAKNLAAQRSLAKAGFTYYDMGEENQDYEQLASGYMSPIESWWLMDEMTLELYQGRHVYGTLYSGWKVYQEAARQITIREL